VHGAAGVKIAHLVIGGDVAGGQIVALRLARAARDAGHEVVFVAPEEGVFTTLVRSEGMRVLTLPAASALDVRAALRLARLLRAERVDVLHTHTHFSGNVLGRVAGQLARARVVAHMHIENAFRAGRGRRAQVALDNLTARLCTWIVSVSDSTAATLVAQGYPRRRMMTVHNGIEPVDEAPPARLDVPEGAPVLGLVGRLCDVKGQRELIRALARLEHRDAVAVLVGKDLEADGAYERDLRREAEQTGVADRVVFAGYRDDVPAVLAALDVFVLPSWIEGLPLVALEAMAQARPVVASAVGGTPELVVDGETGLLVPAKDVDALARAIDKLLADPDLARRLGDTGRRRVREQFSAAGAAERVLELYTAAP
jgi:glycosyltransferase involved in cell wall biosynthesis